MNHRLSSERAICALNPDDLHGKSRAVIRAPITSQVRSERVKERSNEAEEAFLIRLAWGDIYSTSGKLSFLGRT